MLQCILHNYLIGLGCPSIIIQNPGLRPPSVDICHDLRPRNDRATFNATTYAEAVLCTLFLCGVPLTVACHFRHCRFSGSYIWTQMQVYGPCFHPFTFIAHKLCLETSIHHVANSHNMFRRLDFLLVYEMIRIRAQKYLVLGERGETTSPVQVPL